MATIPIKGTRRGIHVFTGVASNHIHRARILCESLKRYHPEFCFHLALADKVPPDLERQTGPFDSIIGMESLDIPNRTGWIFSHNVTELCTAIKPFVLRRLLQLDDCQQVYFFDADIVLFDAIDELIEMLDTCNIILTPHQTSPEATLEAIVDNEICSLRHGIYNLGFLGVRNEPETKRFADWWAHRLYHFCQEALDMHLWTDQKWINHVPVFFEGVRIVKSPRFNVAPWNITTRRLEGSFEKGFTVNGEPLGFYHFTGFDSGAHELMAKKYAPRNPAVESLINWYQRANKSGQESSQNAPWAYSAFENGEPITRLHRLTYRLRKDLQEAYPNPFEVKPGVKSYYDWFRRRGAVESLSLGLAGEAVVTTEELRPVDKYHLRKVLNSLSYPKAGSLVGVAKFLLLIEHYAAWTRFHYQTEGPKNVLARARRAVRRTLFGRRRSKPLPPEGGGGTLTAS
jgi:lipopolysaccharide biosynthesis glycosyltransferase